MCRVKAPTSAGCARLRWAQLEWTGKCGRTAKDRLVHKGFNGVVTTLSAGWRGEGKLLCGWYK